MNSPHKWQVIATVRIEGQIDVLLPETARNEAESIIRGALKNIAGLSPVDVGISVTRKIL